MVKTIGNNGASLEQQANKLLKPYFNTRTDKSNGIYTEKQLQEHARKELSIDDVGIVIEKTEDLFDCSWRILKHCAIIAKCTDRQIDFLSWRRFGMTYAQIAETTKDTWHCSYRTVMRDIKQAAIRIEKTNEYCIISVLAEVFKCSTERIKYLLGRN